MKSIIVNFTGRFSVHFVLFTPDNSLSVYNTKFKLIHKKLKIYGRLDCPSALRYIAKGQYVKNRVFFKDEETAIAAGFRPCAKCMPKEYKLWKEKQGK